MTRAFRLSLLIVVPSIVSAQSITHAIELFDQYRYDDAKMEFQKLASREADKAMATYYLGRIAVVELDENTAIDDFEKASNLDERTALYHAWLGNAVCDKAVHSSVIKQPFMARRVMSEWSRAITLDPELNDTRLSLVQFYAVVPAFMGGGLGRARLEAAELAKRSPRHAALARAFVAEAQKNPLQEEEAYMQSIAAAPDSIIGYLLLAEAYLRQGKTAEAFKAIDSYVARNPDDLWIPFQIGRISAGSGQRLDAGAKALKEFLSKPPRNATRRNLAEAQYRLGQIAQKGNLKLDAQQYYLAARQINPNVDAVRNLRSLTCR